MEYVVKRNLFDYFRLVKGWLRCYAPRNDYAPN